MEQQFEQKTITAQIRLTIKHDLQYVKYSFIEWLKEYPFVEITLTTPERFCILFTPTNIRDLADGNFELNELKEELNKFNFVEVEHVGDWKILGE